MGATPASARTLLPLPCPECLMRGHQVSIGNKPGRCGTCNRFRQQLVRQVFRRFAHRYPQEYRELWTRVGMDLYPQVIDRFAQEYPDAGADELVLDQHGQPSHRLDRAPTVGDTTGR